jgi:hypothetical protein
VIIIVGEILMVFGKKRVELDEMNIKIENNNEEESLNYVALNNLDKSN